MGICTRVSVLGIAKMTSGCWRRLLFLEVIEILFSLNIYKLAVGRHGQQHGTMEHIFLLFLLPSFRRWACAM